MYCYSIIVLQLVDVYFTSGVGNDCQTSQEERIHLHC